MRTPSCVLAMPLWVWSSSRATGGGTGGVMRSARSWNRLLSFAPILSAQMHHRNRHGARSPGAAWRWTRRTRHAGPSLAVSAAVGCQSTDPVPSQLVDNGVVSSFPQTKPLPCAKCVLGDAVRLGLVDTLRITPSGSRRCRLMRLALSARRSKEQGGPAG